MGVSNLNPAQKRAVEHGQGPLLVVAGAGTGKTEVIGQRIAYLIENKLAKPDEILALTFTEKAAGEMIDRLDSLLGWSAHQINVMTFHAFGSQVLIRFGHHAGLPNRAELLSKNTKMLLLRQHFSETELSYYSTHSNLLDFISGSVDYIEALQNNDTSVEEFENYVKQLKTSAVHPLDLDEASDRLKIYRLYETLKKRYGLIDHYDQITLPLRLLQARPNVAEKLREQYRHVLVDEYQDTNLAQDLLLRCLVPKNGNIFAVGDDDQAIYGFRGARIENILQFAEHFELKSPVVLTQNYRSSQKILDVAYQLIQHNNPERLEVKLGVNKRLKGELLGYAPEFKAYPSSQEEFSGIADSISERLKDGEVAENIGVLSTTHLPLQSISRFLRRRNIPYRLVSSVNIFETREMLHLWHLLRWLAFQVDDEAVIQLLLGPFFDWPSEEVRQLTELMRKELVGTEEALNLIQTERSKSVSAQLDEWRRWAGEVGVSELAYRLVTTTGLSEKWISSAGNTPRMLRVFEDLQLLLNQMQEYEAVATEPTLSAYLNFFPQPPQIEAHELAGDDRGVALLTVHAAKGLEFETVFLMNNTREAWTSLAVPNRVELPEEILSNDLQLPPEHERRRLLYVAITRAKTNLVLSVPQLDRGGRERKLSPFLPEIFGPKELKRPVAPLQLTNKLEEAAAQLERFAPPTMQWHSGSLPFESADGWLELNITDLQKYLDCPYEFYLEKVLKISSPMGPNVNFGSLLHKLFEDYYQSRKVGDKIGLDQLESRLEEGWSNQGYRTGVEADQAKQKAADTLRSFFVREESRKDKLVSSEESIRFSLNEAKLRLKGRIDATFETESGLQIRDFKTGRLRDAEKLNQKAKNNFQLRTYALAVEAMTGQAPAEVVLDYVVTGVEGRAKLSPQILHNHREKLIKTAADIRDRKFEPNKSMYHKCIAYRYWGSGEEDIQ